MYTQYREILLPKILSILGEYLDETGDDNGVKSISLAVANGLIISSTMLLHDTHKYRWLNSKEDGGSFVHDVEDEWSCITETDVKREADTRTLLLAVHNVVPRSPWPPPTAFGTTSHLFLDRLAFLM
ncbi:unnamed protein product [Nezara viridula]|uniref:Uncharacterized protein n=1 Tax=Nezara viridula TaxID=85310 RepID=A0A9P0E474_NEZVI|nr:unnamed protein product [Nezara viridula]